MLSLARSKRSANLADDDDVDDDDIDDDDEGANKSETVPTEDGANEPADETELDTEVWIADTDATPAISFLDGRWDRALSRLDIQDLPVTEKENVDAITDIAAMLDDRVRMVPETTQETEARILLSDIASHTGLSNAQTIDIITTQTELFQVNEAFKHSFADGETTTITDPFAQETDDTTDASSTTTEDADDQSDDETAESGTGPATDDSSNTDSESQSQDGKYSLEGLEDALPDDSESTDSNDDPTVSEDETQSDTAETDSDINTSAEESIDSEEDNSDTDGFSPEDYW